MRAGLCWWRGSLLFEDRDSGAFLGRWKAGRRVCERWRCWGLGRQALSDITDAAERESTRWPLLLSSLRILWRGPFAVGRAVNVKACARESHRSGVRLSRMQWWWMQSAAASGWVAVAGVYGSVGRAEAQPRRATRTRIAAWNPLLW